MLVCSIICAVFSVSAKLALFTGHSLSLQCLGEIPDAGDEISRFDSHF